MTEAQTTGVAAFQTKGDLQRAEALRAYIAGARKHSAELTPEWEALKWEGVGYFVKQSHAPRGSMTKDIPAEASLDRAFRDFARAFVVERHLAKANHSRSQFIKHLQLLRMIEESLLDLRGSADPLLVDLAVMDETAKRAAKMSQSTAYKVGHELQSFGRLMAKKGILLPVCEGWKNPNPQAKNDTHAVDEEAHLRRLKKLPDESALLALAEIFNRRLDPGDQRDYRNIFTTSTAALLMCAPSRGAQIIRLPHNLEFRATDKFGEEQMGLRVEASKGFGAYVKWVWSGMVPVAEIAISRLKETTESARDLARYYEDPTRNHRFYRHPECPAVGDHEPLTAAQVCAALGYKVSEPKIFLRTKKMGAKDGTYTLQTLWDEFVLPEHKRLCPSFPYVSEKDRALGEKGGLKYSEALYCMHRHQLNGAIGRPSPIYLWMPTLAIFTHDTGPGKMSISIFERHQYTNADGISLKLTSHQLRHLLNTEAQRAGLSDDQIAYWSGRINKAQNAVYDHRSPAERLEQTRDIMEKTAAAVALKPRSAVESTEIRSGEWVVKLVRMPKDAAEIIELQPRLTGLRTEYGECHHDWALAPCEGFVKCLDCSEHACIKGSDALAQVKIERLRALRENVLREIDRATAASKEEIGAEDWLAVQVRYAAKLEQLIELLQSEEVPDGSPIRLAAGQHPTHVHRALRGLAKKAIENGTQPKAVMEQLLVSLEEGLRGAVSESGTDSDAVPRLALS